MWSGKNENAVIRDEVPTFVGMTSALRGSQKKYRTSQNNPRSVVIPAKAFLCHPCESRGGDLVPYHKFKINLL